MSLIVGLFLVISIFSIFKTSQLIQKVFLNDSDRTLKFLSDPSLTDFEKNFGKENNLDGCYHVYLDVGSNIGIQVRKLFEPKLYPDSPIFPLFDKYFGPLDENRAKMVCAVGFEPNPRHTLHLKNIELAHKNCSWRSYFYTATAGACLFLNIFYKILAL